MKRGSIAILIILLVAIGAGAVSVWYHYANQRLVQEFWGTSAARLITQAPQVTAMRLGEPGSAISPDEELDSPDDAEPAADSPAEDNDNAAKDDTAEAVLEAPKMALEFDQVPWLVVDSSDAARAKGIGNLRRALVLDSTYDWSTPPEEEPQWQYALDMTDGRDWAAVLFDLDTRQIGLAGGRRTLVMHEAAAGEFMKFFDEQLGEHAEQPEQPAGERDEHHNADTTPSEEPAAEPAEQDSTASETTSSE